MLSENKVKRSKNDIKKSYKSMFVKSNWRGFGKFLNLLLNPNHFLLKSERFNQHTNIKTDIRSSSNFRLAGRKLFYAFRTIVLIGLDNSAVVLSWLLIKRYLEFAAKNSDWLQLQPVLDNNFITQIVIINLFIFFASGLYSLRATSRRLWDVIKATTLTYSTLFFLSYAGTKINLDTHWLWLIIFLAWPLNLLIVSGERFVIFKIIAFVRHRFVLLRRKILLVGNQEDLVHYQTLLANNDSFKISQKLNLSKLESEAYFPEILQRVLSHDLDEVFICSWGKIEQRTKLFWNLQTSGISWRILPLNQTIPQQNPELNEIQGVPTIRYNSPAIIGMDFIIKRSFDLIVASLLLLVLGLPMLIIGILIKLDSPGSVFYKQARIGLRGKKFQVWKFRTMVENASQLQQQLEAQNQVSGGILFKIQDDPRITAIGKHLRRYSLDELPQLFNVLRGDMSLVGPRPLPVRDVAKFAKHHHFRHEVLPGVTGLWQVSGRSDTDSEQVFNLDFSYIQNWSLSLDIQILFKTVQVVLFSKGAY